MNNSALFKIGYGLYVLSSREGDRDNACIVNTVAQVTAAPCRITVAVNKQNFTHDMIMRSRLFNASVLTEETPFDIFRQYGYQSGKDTDKFQGQKFARSENGLIYLPDVSNAWISGKVSDVIDLGTHSLFLADLTDAEVLSEVPSVTYDYYQKKIKPAPPAQKGKGWRCRICGYVYEGEVLPPDYVCPICKHGAADFERID
ncbi:MAG: flavin reductase [Planctomycetia bacterium]|nr:flavin reductase [Planctomycetia bacterium]